MRTSDSLQEIMSWSYRDIMRANEWLDLMEKLDEKQAEIEKRKQ